MKIAIVYNHSSESVINLFGIPNREGIARGTIRRIAAGLRTAKHQVKTIEGDKDLVQRLEEFMPRVLKGERPGMVFNISYGIQGQARYTHVPSILEMVGIPYVGSGPLAHSLALDKVVAKMIFKQNQIPTPEFALLNEPDFPLPDLPFPMIIKPKNEAVSFGLKIVQNERELREGAGEIFDYYKQPVLAEQYIDGREINIGLLGNSPPETLPAVELIFGPEGPPIYRLEDKMRKSGREIKWECPADIDAELTARARDLALRSFNAVGCYDCARVDMRLDKEGNVHVLEINSLPSLGERSSYTIAARQAGLDFSKLVCRLVEVASARYFGTPSPPRIHTVKKGLHDDVFSYLIQRRDRIEHRLQDWVNHHSRSSDPAGILESGKRLLQSLEEMKMSAVTEFTDAPAVWTWQTKAGLEGGTLLVGHLDVPIGTNLPVQSFRRDPEWLYGEGIGVSRAPLVMMEFALRSLRSMRRLYKLPLGVLYYADEGRECIFSREIIQQAAMKAKEVLVLRPGNIGNHIITQRRGWRKYRLTVDGNPRRLGKAYKTRGVLRWTSNKLDELAKLSSREDRLAVAASEMRTEAFPRLLPHRVTVSILVSFLDEKKAENTDKEIRAILDDGSWKWQLELLSERPPMKKRKKNDPLFRSLKASAEKWEIPLLQESSLYPSVAGLVPPSAAVICGMGPIAVDIDTPQEAVQRISILQRTLLLSQFLIERLKDK